VTPANGAIFTIVEWHGGMPQPDGCGDHAQHDESERLALVFLGGSSDHCALLAESLADKECQGHDTYEA
jgi:hypothetical protein